ncbi:uncharacterized protein LOC144657158 [Oculina patagonica]
MASHLKIVFVTLLLMFILTNEFKPVLAKRGRLKQKVKILEKSLADLKAKMEGQEAKMEEQEARTTEQEAKMEEQETKMQEQEVKMQEQEAKTKEQEEKIEALEDCDACSKIKDLNDTINELQGKGGSKTTPAAAGLEDSEILKTNPSYLKVMGEFLEPVVQSNTHWRRCWLASRDGWATITFHTNCDNKGPSVTIVRVGKYIFGGYTSLAWTTKCQWPHDPAAFMFSLVNKPGWQPLKLYQTGVQNKRYSIYSCTNDGPTFGNSDLYIAENASSSNRSVSNLGSTYGPPTGYDYKSSFARSFLAGSYYFSPDEVEIFYKTT